MNNVEEKTRRSVFFNIYNIFPFKSFESSKLYLFLMLFPFTLKKKSASKNKIQDSNCLEGYKTLKLALWPIVIVIEPESGLGPGNGKSQKTGSG